MLLETYISDLLYRYDCVIVPEFGAFLSHRISAQINKDQHLFIPPKKRLSFNGQIQHNDGLLCNHVAEVEKIPYTKAIEEVQKAVKDFNSRLESSGEIVFEGIGKLLRTESGLLEFQPNPEINYLTSSFGLSEFNSIAIERELAISEDTSTTEEPAAIPLLEETPTKRPWLRYIAAAVVILGLGGYAGLQMYKNQVSAHNLMAQEEANKAVETKVQEATFVISNPLPSALLEVEKQEQPFHVVAGAFRIEANSDKKVEQLKALGYNARKIGVNKYGLHQVVYSSHSTRAEAQDALWNIRFDHNPEAWMLVKALD